MKNLIRASFTASLPVLMGYTAVGIAFGLTAMENNLTPLTALAMSGFIYAGSMQFVTVDIFTHFSGYFNVFLLTLLVNFRHIFYGLPLIADYNKAGKKKWYMIFALTDETYAILQHNRKHTGRDRIMFCFLVSLFDQGYWIIGTLIGVMLKGVLPFSTAGIDFAMTALFIVLFLDLISDKAHFTSGMGGILLSWICLLIFGTQYFVVAALILIVIIVSVDWKKDRQS